MNSKLIIGDLVDVQRLSTCILFTVLLVFVRYQAFAGLYILCQLRFLEFQLEFVQRRFFICSPLMLLPPIHLSS